MTQARQYELQEAVVARLRDHLSGQNLGGDDVMVVDHVPANPPRLYVRVDGFYLVPGRTGAGRRDKHVFFAHAFDTNNGDETGVGGKEASRLMTLITAALDEWSPLNGATAITFLGSNSAEDTDPLVQHRIGRFSTIVGE